MSANLHAYTEHGEYGVSTQCNNLTQEDEANPRNSDRVSPVRNWPSNNHSATNKQVFLLHPQWEVVP